MKHLLPLLLIFCPFWANAQTLEQSLQAELTQKGIPGISVSVILAGETQTTTVGMADPDEGISLAEKHRMLSGSIGKTYFAALIMQLVDEGTLDLDKKAIDYLTGADWLLTLPNARQITLRSLMNHTSGIPEYVYANDLWKTIKERPEKQWSAEERLVFIQGQEPLFKVGKGWSYADANYIILGVIVEKVTGRSIYDLVTERILQPFGLSQTEPSIRPDLENITAAYTGNLFGNIFGEKVSEIDHYGLNPQFEWTGGGFITNSADLAAWAKIFYSGDLFSPAAHVQVFSPVNRQTGKPNPVTGYGLGTEIFATSHGVAYGHTGFMPGFLSLMAYLPEYEMAVALQVNTDPYSSLVKERFSVFDLLEVVLPYYIKKNKAYKKKTTLYMVRHAEKENDGTRNPDLNAEGKQRAQHLAEVLADAGVKAIYSTPFKRTEETVRPLAEKSGLGVQTYSPNYMTHVFDFIANHQGQPILVAGHSNTIPAMINWLITDEKIPQLEEDAYGDLFMLKYKKGKAKLDKSKF